MGPKVYPHIFPDKISFITINKTEIRQPMSKKWIFFLILRRKKLFSFWKAHFESKMWEKRYKKSSFVDEKSLFLRRSWPLSDQRSNEKSKRKRRNVFFLPPDHQHHHGGPRVKACKTVGLEKIGNSRVVNRREIFAKYFFGNSYVGGKKLSMKASKDTFF